MNFFRKESFDDKVDVFLEENEDELNENLFKVVQTFINENQLTKTTHENNVTFMLKLLQKESFSRKLPLLFIILFELEPQYTERYTEVFNNLIEQLQSTQEKEYYNFFIKDMVFFHYQIQKLNDFETYYNNTIKVWQLTQLTTKEIQEKRDRNQQNVDLFTKNVLEVGKHKQIQKLQEEKIQIREALDKIKKDIKSKFLYKI